MDIVREVIEFHTGKKKASQKSNGGPTWPVWPYGPGGMEKQEKENGLCVARHYKLLITCE